MAVQEYLTFDPRPRKKLALHGYRLARVGQYEEIAPDHEGGVRLERVGLRVAAQPADRAAGHGPLLRWYRPDGTPVPHLWEEAGARLQAEEREWQADRDRQQAQLERRLAERARRRAEQAQERERQARLQAEQERDALQAVLARLRAQLGQEDNADPDG